jgi:hypothetical protein
MTRTRNLSPQEKGRLVTGIFFVSACLCLIACYLAYGQWQLNRTGVIASGEVVSFTSSKNKFPVVRFETPNGESHTFNGRAYSAFSPFRLGDHVDVIYPPDRPQDARVVKNQWLGAWIFAIMAAIVGGIGVLIRSISGWKVVTHP